MKTRIIAMLVALALLLGLTQACLAEPAEALPVAALPQVGDVVNGFEVIELRDYPLMDGVIVRFRHRKTGAELYYLANDDTNRAFDLTFFTDTTDNTGLPHVFEHATTAGSEKYPSASLWFNLSYQTYNTYMNAMTANRFTSYPLASLSEAQLLKYADYYTDSCFNPTLMENEQVYRTEAWRYRMDDPDDDLTIEGTVYSEMLGAWTLTRNAGLNAKRAMFPGSMAANDSGGDPDCIPDLTWETLKDYHDLYYHPSNCVAYLYGQFEDYAAFLELLDSYFAPYEQRKFTHDDTGYTPITEPVVQTLPFPVEQGSNTDRASVVYYGIVCPGLKADRQQRLLVNTLTDLLTDGASNFQQSLQEALPYGKFTSYIEMGGPEYAIMFVAENVNPEDAETFKATVDAALEEVAENGFPQDQLDGVMASLKISALLSREGSNPVDSFITSAASYYANTGNPWERLDYQDSMSEMDAWNRDGLYAKAVSDWLLGCETWVLVTTYPEPGGKEAKDAALAEKLAGIKAGMSDEEIVRIVADSNAPAAKDDSSEYVAQLQGVTVASLPEELKQYAVTDDIDVSGVRRIDAVAGVEGVGSANVFLDANGLAQKDIHWAQLYTDLMTELDTAAHTKAELATLIGRYLNTSSIMLETLAQSDGSWNAWLVLSWIALDDDLDESYDLMHEILFDTAMDDADKLLEQVKAIKSSLRGSITTNPASVMLRRAYGISSERMRYKSYAQDLDYYDFIVSTEQLLQDDPEAAIAKLRDIQAYFNNRANAVTVFAGNEASVALNRAEADRFLSTLDDRPIARVECDLPVPARSEALIIDSGVQYNLLVADYAALELEGYNGEMEAVTSAVSDMFLIPLLRDQYGVYGPSNKAYPDADLGMYVFAYRDPNIAETYEMLNELPALLADADIDQDTLEGYILQSYSTYAQSEGELNGALETALFTLQGFPLDRKLTWMRDLKKLTPESLKGYADVYAKLSENGMRKTAGSAAAINANADLFDAILNPFGAVDKTQVSFNDVPEGSAHYDAVRAVYEQGLMEPAGEAEFGADEPASTADLLTAAYVLTGGPADAEEALSVFAEYGLAPADADLAAPIAPEDMWSLLGALASQAIDPLTETAQPDAVTRGELAEALNAFMAG